MTTLEDKILGEKKDYYCDESSEEEREDVPSDASAAAAQPEYSTADSSKDGTTVNTGPKGVIADWQRYKQLQSEKREEQEEERRMLINKLSLTCRSTLDDEREKQMLSKADEELDKELEELMAESFLKEYVQKRMEEMIVSAKQLPTFGHVINIANCEQFLGAVDKEHKDVKVVIHLYEDKVPSCEAMNGCLQCLAQEYPRVKFCRLKASVAGLTKKFKVSGVPALLVYKDGNLVGNFVQLTKELGDDFFAVDVEAFLIENGILQDKTLVPEILQSSSLVSKDDASSGSDFELD